MNNERYLTSNFAVDPNMYSGEGFVIVSLLGFAAVLLELEDQPLAGVY